MKRRNNYDGIDHVRDVITEYSNTQSASSVFTPKNAGPKYIYGLRRARVPNYHGYLVVNSCSSPDFAFSGNYDCVVQYPLITKVAKVVLQKDDITFDNAGNRITETTKYFYSYNSLLPSRTEMNLSSGSTLDQ